MIIRNGFGFHDKVRVYSSRNGVRGVEGVVTGWGPPGWIRVRCYVGGKPVSDYYRPKEVALVTKSLRRISHEQYRRRLGLT